MRPGHRPADVVQEKLVLAQSGTSLPTSSTPLAPVPLPVEPVLGPPARPMKPGQMRAGRSLLNPLDVISEVVPAN